MSDSDDVLSETELEGPLHEGGKHKRPGRPVGQKQVNYSMGEVSTAFDVLMNDCPSSFSSEAFILRLQKELKEKFKSDRTVVALQSFVKSKLRDSVPELYNRKYKNGQKQPTLREELFLRAFMKGTQWERTTFKKTAKKEMPNDTPEPEVRTDKQKKPESTVEKTMKGRYGPIPMKRTVSFQNQNRFEPQATSTPTARLKAKAGCSRSTTEMNCDLSPHVQTFIRDMMEDFKQDAMQEIKRMCTTEQRKRSREHIENECKKKRVNAVNEEKEIEWIDIADTTDEEDDLMTAVNADIVVKEEGNNDDEGKATEQERQVTKKRLKPTEDEIIEEEEKKMDTDEDKSSSDVSNVEHWEDQVQAVEEKEEEKRDTTQVKGPTPATEDEEGTNLEQREDQIMRVEEKRAVTEDAQETTSGENTDTGNMLRHLLQHTLSTDLQLAQIATSTEARQRSTSFQLSPLRARISTLTVLEVFKVTEQEPTCRDKASFRVLEEADGSLKMCHASAVEENDWSTSCTVDAHETTLEEEIESINKRDIVEVCKAGGPLSPMVVTDLSSTKKSFQAATIVSKGRAVKTLFRRKDK